jgi:hypothetical protein
MVNYLYIHHNVPDSHYIKSSIYNTVNVISLEELHKISNDDTGHKRIGLMVHNDANASGFIDQTIEYLLGDVGKIADSNDARDAHDVHDVIDVISCGYSGRYKNRVNYCDGYIGMNNFILNDIHGEPVDLKNASGYFNDNIEIWRHVLGTEITPATLESYFGDDLTYDPTTFTYTLHNDIVWQPFTGGFNYYIILSGGMTFDGRHHTIRVGTDGKGNNCGIFQNTLGYTVADYTPFLNAPAVKNLTIRSTVVDFSSTVGSGAFFQGQCYSFNIMNCKHIGNITSYNGRGNGAITSQSMYDMNGTIVNNSTFGIYVNGFKQIGDFSGMGSGGLIGGGIANGICYSNWQNSPVSLPTMSVDIIFKNCTCKGKGLGLNVGGLVGGYNDTNLFNQNNSNYTYLSYGLGGCIGNNNCNAYCTISIDVKHCKDFGDIKGKNTGGLFGGSDNYCTIEDVGSGQFTISYTCNGGGCIGNLNFGIINVSIKECCTHGTIEGDNSGGLCGGGDSNSIGGGCMGNSNYNLINIKIKDVKHYGNMYGNNCGGICGAGTLYINGGGCIGNSSNIFTQQGVPINTVGNTTVSIKHCKSYGKIRGNNCGGILGAGNSTVSVSNLADGIEFPCGGGGCMSNNAQQNTVFTGAIKCCKFKGKLYGNNCGGICGAGDNIPLDQLYGEEGGGGCIGNTCVNSTVNCVVKTCNVNAKITGDHCGGILGAGINYYTKSGGGGCCINYDFSSNVSLILSKCNYTGNITGDCSGGLLAGSPNIAGNGGGCCGNYTDLIGTPLTISNVQLIISDCNTQCSLIGENCGGLCGGGLDSTNHVVNTQILGLGSMGWGNITITIKSNTYNGNICGNNSGGLVSGCIAGYINSENDGNNLPCTFIIDITHNNVTSYIEGMYCGGIIGGQNCLFAYINDGSGASIVCTGTIDKCNVITSLGGYQSAGIASSLNLQLGANPDVTSTILIDKCYLKINKIEYTAGCLIAGGVNNIYGNLDTTTISNINIEFNNRHKSKFQYGLIGLSGMVNNTTGTPIITINNIFIDHRDNFQFVPWNLNISTTNTYARTKSIKSKSPTKLGLTSHYWHKKHHFPRLIVNQ